MKVKWGFDWAKVGSGAVMLLLGGGVALAFLAGGRIHFWSIGLAVVGVFTLINGLMGEEGVW